METPGTTTAAIIVTASADVPVTTDIGEIVRRASRSVMPLISEMTQKALSVIHEIGLLPAPIAIAKYTG